MLVCQFAGEISGTGWSGADRCSGCFGLKNRVVWLPVRHNHFGKGTRERIIGIFAHFCSRQAYFPIFEDSHYERYPPQLDP
jgi:hypothetical protein